jgi:hypothetical protein
MNDTINARCKHKIKSKIATVQAAFNKKREPFTGNGTEHLRTKLAKSYIWSSFVRCGKTGTPDSRSEMPGKL